ncbi:MAG: serine/threonine protein kinase [Planctomycetes bacterium]|nr:serine/threonine protein kinase [Planctomycetota bacterium]
MSDDTSVQFKFLRKVEDLFHAALEYPPDERSRFLDRECGGDIAIRGKIERLLARDENTCALLDEPAWCPGFSTPSPESLTQDEMSNQLVGPYRLQRLLGTGGMGTVWLAERADAQYDKQVAIKLIKRGMDTDDILRRFRNERQMLANLEHPYIARLLDGAATDDGRPYLVMEHVDGVPIDRFCDENHLNISERLELFIRVCSAVQHAHQNLVIHRDLKPGNIMVTREGDPKLLDFGIAKVLSSEGSEHTAEMTAVGQRVLTPRYASPEQVRGEPVATTSDVYSLGVLLYELLSGRSPYPADSSSAQVLTRLICEHEPEKPSTAVIRTANEIAAKGASQIPPTSDAISRMRCLDNPKRLRGRIAGDLDLIVLKALHKDPEQRYSSVEQFAADVRRHLSHEPISAGSPSTAYRMRKFVRRHRAGVLACGVGGLMLIAGAIGLTVGLMQAVEARTDAMHQARIATAVNDFLNDMLMEASPGEHMHGAQATVEDVLDAASQQIDSSFRENPEIEAAVRLTFGRTYNELGRYDAAELHLRRSLDVRSKLFGAEHASVDEAANALGLMYFESGEYDQAEPLALGVLSHEGTLYNADHLNLAEARNILSAVLWARGDFDAAEPILRNALGMLRRIRGPEHRDVATYLHNLGVLLWNAGDHAAAIAPTTEAIEMRRRLFGDDHPRVAASLSNLAAIWAEQGHYARAEPSLREALDMRIRLQGPDAWWTGDTRCHLGYCLMKLGHYDEAELELLAAWQSLVDGLGEEHFRTQRAIERLVVLYDKREEPEQARQWRAELVNPTD